MVKNIKIVVESSRFYKGLRGIVFFKNRKKTPKTIKMCIKNSICSQNVKKIPQNRGFLNGNVFNKRLKEFL